MSSFLERKRDGGSPDGVSARESSLCAEETLVLNVWMRLQARSRVQGKSSLKIGGRVVCITFHCLSIGPVRGR